MARSGLLVTIGIEPTHAATGFGYIRSGDALSGFASARAVTEFVEKPDAERAEAYLASGEYRWNAGMFVARAATLLDLLAENHPELSAGLRSIAADPSHARRSAGRGWRRSRSTTRSPSPRPRPAGWRWCPGRSAGRTWATSRRWRS